MSEDDLFAACGDQVVWRRVPEIPAYEVSNFGDVRNARHGRRISTRLLDGYRICNIRRRPGKRMTTKVSRLVALAFIGPPPGPRHMACHNDGNKLNNHLLNIRWGTFLDNARDAVLHRSQICSPRTLVALQAAAIKALLSAGFMQKEISQLLGVGRSKVANISAGINWKHLKIAPAGVSLTN